MERSLLATIAALGLASSASAATLSLDTDAPSYGVGDTVEITLTLDVDGGELATSVVARVVWDAGIASAAGRANQNAALTFFDGFVSASVGSGSCLVGSCTMIDQLLAGGSAVPVDGPATVVSTLALTIDALGDQGLDLGIDPSAFVVFGLGADDVVIGTNLQNLTIVPEPGTPLLMGLGLLGLAGARRRR